MVVVAIAIAGVVLGEAHGGTEYVNGERDDHQGDVRLEECGGKVLVGKEDAEGGCEAERDKVGEAVELRSEFRTRVHEACGKTVEFVEQDAQDNEVGAHENRVGGGECPGGPADRKYTQKEI